MNTLDSPLEVLALDYLSFGLLTVVNNVWTWVAVITAAVSVWRIRSSSPRCQFPSQASLINPAVPSVSPSPVERLAAVEPAAPTPARVVETPRPSSPCVFNTEGRTSGKFTFYYDREQEVEEEANVEYNGGDADGEDENGVRRRKSERVKDGWELMMEIRMGDHLGFYRYQDLTVLDGNVVRLWDGCRKRNVINAAPLLKCGGCEW